MASLVKKKKGHRLYYYLVESARVDGKPRIVHQAYLGTAEKLAELVQQKSAPVPLSATLRDFGLPGALWLAAKQSGVWPLLESLWPAPRSGPGPAHYLLLAAIHRICDPGPKTEVSNWYEKTIAGCAPGFHSQVRRLERLWRARTIRRHGRKKSLWRGSSELLKTIDAVERHQPRVGRIAPH